MKKFLVGVLSLALLIPALSVSAAESEYTQEEEKIIKELSQDKSYNNLYPTSDEFKEGKVSRIETEVDTTWVGSEDLKAKEEEAEDEVKPFRVDCDCKPIKMRTNVIDMYGIPLEYTIKYGEFSIFKRPGVYYYQQNAKTTWFDMASGDVAKMAANGLGTFVSYKIIDKIPYVARLLDKYGKEKPYNWQDYAKSAAAVSAQYNFPLWGSIVSASVPKRGTETILVYLSEDDENWERRINIQIDSDGTVTTKKWWVD
ncbi:hypothetical protein [Brevibacillus laterosporus]|uniref:hypothetical protein n=1 Tax=Brevibacillus laterosporus TaxID=1465 RepID=UPI00264B759D|nr:hypothetical protein [Brevibacillus laterosporus]MDN9012877.1 hypothetical protein [Brevibacillus laterosporus]MDO0943954.1 hypothetical protein [Brevibacillus laterosporus]